MRAIIIDDEEDVHRVITRILDQKCPEVRIVGNARSVKSGLELIRESEPDIVFLDIKMPGGTGFDILEKLGDMPFKLIFVTAYDEYALKAIQFSALDYVLKPINSKDLVRAVQKVPDLESQGERVRAMIGQMSGEGRKRKLSVPSVGKVQYIEMGDLIHLSSEGAYCNLILINGQTILSSKSLGYYEERLVEHGFYRIHRSHMINLSHVVEYFKKDGGDNVVMKDGTIIPIYRKKRTEFLKVMEEFNN